MIRVIDSVEIIFDWIRDSSEIGDIKRFENLGTMNYYLFFKLLFYFITTRKDQRIFFVRAICICLAK